MADAARRPTLDEQIGQLFMVGFSGTEPTSDVIELIQRQRVGGIILFSRNCKDARQVSRLTAALQTAARDAGHPSPLLIAVDQENGLVRRLGDAITGFPGNMALGAAGSEDLVFAVAEATGQELRTLGINMNLAPDADVNNNPANPVIGVRSFGENAQRVARLTAAAVRGFAAAGTISTLKHFPGHGDTAVDSHLRLPTIPHSLERLEHVELPPFRAGVAARADAVMLAHLRLPVLAPDEDVPASLSPTVLHLLRESVGFDGVAITDCLEMDAVSRTVGEPRGALLALSAGADVVLISHHIEPQRAAIELVRAAVATGELPADIVRRAAGRVRRLKERMLSWEKLPAPVAVDSVSTDAHRRLRDGAYTRTTTVIRDEAALLPLRLRPDERILVVAQPPGSVTKAVDIVYRHDDLVEALQAFHPQARGICLDAESTQDDITQVMQGAAESAIVVMATINAHLDVRQASLMHQLLATGRPVIGVAVCNPYDLAAYPSLNTYLATYEYTRPALTAVAGALFGAFTPSGRLPVSLPPSIRSSPPATQP